MSFRFQVFLFLKNSTLQVILEDLPDEFAEALQDYNRQVTDVFSQYLTTVAAELEKDRGEENKLPLSGIGKKDTLLAVVQCVNSPHIISIDY